MNWKTMLGLFLIGFFLDDIIKLVKKMRGRE